MNCPSEKSNIYRFFFNTFCPLAQNPTVLPNGDSGKITKLKGKIENDLGTWNYRKTGTEEESALGPWSPFPNKEYTLYRMWEWYFRWVCKEWELGASQHANLSICDEASKVSFFSHQNLRINPFPSHLFAGSTKGSRTSRCQSLLAGLRVWEEATRERKCRVRAGSCFLQVGRIMANESPWDSLRARASQFFFLLMLSSFPIFRYSFLPAPSMF